MKMPGRKESVETSGRLNGTSLAFIWPSRAQIIHGLNQCWHLWVILEHMLVMLGHGYLKCITREINTPINKSKLMNPK